MSASLRPYRVTVVGGRSMGTFALLTSAVAKAREWADRNYPAFIHMTSGIIEVQRGGGLRLPPDPVGQACAPRGRRRHARRRASCRRGADAMRRVCFHGRPECEFCGVGPTEAPGTRCVSCGRRLWQRHRAQCLRCITRGVVAPQLDVDEAVAYEDGDGDG